MTESDDLSPSPAAAPDPETPSGQAIADAIAAVAPSLAIIIVSRDLHIRYVSGPIVLHRHGYDPPALVGRHLSDLLPADRYTELLPLYEQALTGRYAERDHRSGDGTALYHVQAGPVVEAGRIVGAVTVSRDVTYERQVERRFQSVLASSADGIVGVDATGRIVSVNDALLTLSGYTELELLGQPVDTLVPDAVRDHHVHQRTTYTAAPRQRPMAAGLPLALRRKDGTEVAVEIGLAPAADGEASVMATVRDLTERQRAAEQLREARQRFEQAFASAPIGMAIVSLDGRWLQVNEAMCEIVERSEDELLHADFQSITHPDDLAGDEALVADLLGGRRERYQLDKRYLLPDGTAVPVSLHVSLIRKPDGEPAYFIAQVVNISHRRAAERALSDERDFLQAMLQSLDAGVVACDPEGRLTMFNAFAARVHAADAEPVDLAQWPGRYRLCHADGTPMSPQEVPLARAAAGEHVRDAELLVRPDGGPATLLSVNAQTIVSADGRNLGAVAVQHDITESRRLQNAFQAAEARWRGAFDHGPVSMVLVDLGATPERPIRSANQAVGRLVGRRPEALDECSLRSLAYTEEDAERIDRLLDGVADDSTHRHEDELRLRHADGDPVWVHVTATASPDPGDGLLAVVHLTDVSERRSYEARLEHLADHDPLTGFFNRRRFDEELARVVALSRRHGRQAALLLIDLDQFKYVNDTYGHLTGDVVIGHVGEVLRSRLRDTDVLGRIGGDEFAVILDEADVDHGRRVAGELLDELRASGLTVATGQTLVVTASIGVVPIDAGWQLTPEELLMEADIAMYDAKDAGRNQVAVAGRQRRQHAKMKARLTWAERINTALKEDRFDLHLQPIVWAQTGDVTRYEALIRLRDEDGTLVPPGRFLPIAERFGQIQEIDQWVMRQTVAALAARPDVHLAMNLSGASIVDAGTVALLSQLLEDHDVLPSRLTVEVTETAAIRSIDVARGFAQQLADLGCRLALDDFGAGFGSFFYLKHLPFTCLKIDGEFIRGMSTSRSDFLTVEAVVKLAKGLGKQTTAEYVSDERTYKLVQALGVDFAQGFLFGRPAPMDDVLDAR